MDRVLALRTLRATGESLARAGATGHLRIVLGGGVAAMVMQGPKSSRVTQDCDVLMVEPSARWSELRFAARAIAAARGLPVDWLNRDCRTYAHLLPPGWPERCEPVDVFGPLEVLVIGRRDLMAMKLMGAHVRPQDLQDLVALGPTPEEFAFLHDHLDRLESESLDRESHDDARTILARLETTGGQA